MHYLHCKVRSSMGDCHSFDPGSNPGPGAFTIFFDMILKLIRANNNTKTIGEKL